MQLIAVGHVGGPIEDIIKKGIIPSEDVQIVAATNTPHTITCFIKAGIPLSERVQLTAVSNWSVIQNLLDSGFIPSEDVQLAAVKYNGFEIMSFFDPSVTSDQVLKAAVKSQPTILNQLIERGIVSSKELESAAVESLEDWFADMPKLSLKSTGRNFPKSVLEKFAQSKYD
ncbi:unnamed protein product, partial [marine sediment metagenome]